ncbi:MAG TPA: hypothetical protein DEH05_16295 [Propionibacteriaceae bacterium]|nr:hypothetical protein [Propionibacteriaceae bacterium]
MDHIQSLALSAPRITAVPVNFEGVDAAARAAGFDPADALVATWCKFGDKLNPTGSGAPFNGNPVLGVVFPTGILATSGTSARHGFDGSSIPFSRCREVDTNHFEGIGFGHFMIHFWGPGGVLMGFLYWTHDAPKASLGSLFGKKRDFRSEIMAVAEEQERVLDAIESVRS